MAKTSVSSKAILFDRTCNEAMKHKKAFLLRKNMRIGNTRLSEQR